MQRFFAAFKAITQSTLILFLYLAMFFELNGQCTNNFQLPSSAIPAPAIGVNTQISTINWQGEYSRISNVEAGAIYTSTINDGSYITVRSGTYNGAVVAHGWSPLTWTASSTANHFLHWNTNASCGSGSTHRTTAIRRPAEYLAEWVSMNTGSASWCFGETRTVSVTIKNIGTKSWADASGVDFNIGVKWSTDANYQIKVDAQDLAPGATATYTFSVTAPSAGTNNLEFDVVREGCFWFASNATACSTRSGPGNTEYTSPNISITGGPVAGQILPAHGYINQNNTLSLSGHIGTVDYWESSTDLSTWANIGNAGLSTITVAPSTATYYRAQVLRCGVTAPSSWAYIQPSNTWIVYGYNHTGYQYNNLASLADHTFMGYYRNNALDINSNNQWCRTCSPSYASNWTGNTMTDDNHTVIYRRKGFPCREYEIDLDLHNDGVQLYINNVLIYSLDDCCADRGIIWQGVLSTNDVVEFRVMEAIGGSELFVNFTAIDNQSISATLSNSPVCTGDTITLSTSFTGTPPRFINSVDLPVNDNACTNQYINVVSTLNANQLSTVLLNIAHTFNADLDITLYAPNGSSIVLSSDNGGATANYTNTTFATSGPNITTGTGPFTGTYRPEQAFTNLTGTANGLWRLEVCDDNSFDEGTLLDCQLNFPNTYTYTWAGPGGFSANTPTPTRSNLSTSHQGQYFVTVTPSIGCSSLTANTAALAVQQVQGTAGTYGIDKWHVSCYNDDNHSGYTGYYTTTRTQSFNMVADGMLSSSNPTSIISGSFNGATVTGYTGCSALWSNNHWSIDARRQGFPCDVYQLSINAHEVEFSIEIDYDGDSVADITYNSLCCNASLGNLGPAMVLNDDSKMKIRLKEATGSAAFELTITPVAYPSLTTGNISGISNGLTICTDGDPGSYAASAPASNGTVTFLNGGSYIYDWESSTTSSGAGYASLGVSTQNYDPGPLTQTTWFRRKVTDKCGAVAYSNVRRVIVVPDASISINTASSVVCPGEPIAITANISNGVNCVASWEYSTNNTSWVSTGSVGSSFNTSATADLYYRAILSSCGPGCDAASSNSHFVDVLLPSQQVALVASSTASTSQCDDGSWTYYLDMADNFIFAINWAPDGSLSTANAAAKALSGVNISVGSMYSAANQDIGTWVMGRYWNVNAPAFDEPVHIRFYYNPTEKLAIELAMNNLDATSPYDAEGFVWFKTAIGAFNPSTPGAINPNGVAIGNNIELSNFSYGVENNVDYVQLNELASFSGGSGATGVGNGNALPIDLVSFTGTKHETYNALQWISASEFNTSHFEVERSKDGIHFLPIGNVSATGSQSSSTTYNWNDNAPLAGITYYRLRISDFDGSFKFSHVLSLERALSGTTLLSLYPNPANEHLNYEIYSAQKAVFTLKVIDNHGRIMYLEHIDLQEGKNNQYLNINSLPNGIYYLSIQGQNEVIHQKFIKQ